MESYASYEDFLLSSHVGKLIKDLSARAEDFESKFIRGDKGSFWHIKFKDSEFLVSIVPVLSRVIEKEENEPETLYYSRVIKSWKK